MSFNNRKMAQNKFLKQAWKAAHRSDFDGDEEFKLPEICDEIGRWMRCSRPPRSRLSLRIFSFMLSGAARIYKKKADELLKESMSSASGSESMEIDSNAIESLPDLEESQNDDHESTVFTVTSEQTVPDKQETIKNTREEIAQTSLPDLEESENDDHESTVLTVTPEQAVTDDQETIKNTTDAITQTSPSKSDDNIPVFDRNCLILLHKGHQTGIPNKIFIATLCENTTVLSIPKPMNNE